MFWGDALSPDHTGAYRIDEAALREAGGTIEALFPQPWHLEPLVECAYEYEALRAFEAKRETPATSDSDLQSGTAAPTAASDRTLDTLVGLLFADGASGMIPSEPAAEWLGLENEAGLDESIIGDYDPAVALGSAAAEPGSSEETDEELDDTDYESLLSGIEDLVAEQDSDEEDDAASEPSSWEHALDGPGDVQPYQAALGGRCEACGSVRLFCTCPDEELEPERNLVVGAPERLIGRWKTVIVSKPAADVTLVESDTSVAREVGTSPALAFTATHALEEVLALRTRGTAILAAAESAQDPALALTALREVRECLALAARLAGYLHDREERS